MRAYKKSRESARGKALPCANLPLFDCQHRQELMSLPTVRIIARKAQVSPALAAVIADLCGLSREA
jgi:hypothetical protein